MEHQISGLACVKELESTIFLGFAGSIPASPIWLLHRDAEVLFEPHDPREKSSASSMLDPDDNVCVDVKSDDEGFTADSVVVAVDALDDWRVDGKKTLQIQMARSTRTLRLTLPQKIELDGKGRPLLFEAHAAVHRMNGQLHLEFTDLDTRLTSTRTVSFDPSFIGGNQPTGYQVISVEAPPGMRRVSLQISIIQVSATGLASEEPWVFLYDLGLTVMPDDDEQPSLIVSKEESAYKWMAARLQANKRPLEIFFVRQADKTYVLPTPIVLNTRAYFSELYYASKNIDIDFSKHDEFTHYLLSGWKEYRKPGPEFSVREYLLRHPDVEAAGCEPLTHYANVGRAKDYSLGSFDSKLMEIWRDTGEDIPSISETNLIARTQDMLVPMHQIDARKLAVFVVPEHNAMSGGIYSIFSIADYVRRTRRRHGFDVLVMTRPNPSGVTYLRNSSFRNSETVLRFDQLRLFAEVSELQLHIPEYASVEFVRSLSPDMMRYLLGRDHLHVNILNQNTRLMPEPQHFRDLRSISHSIGQSVSHHAFFGQKFSDYYDLPSLLLPAYTDLTPYPPAEFEEKENLIIYSSDEAPYRSAVLEKLSRMKDYRLVEIKDMNFDTYMDLATRCKFSVSFGEGFDGYVAQPIYQKGIGFALYTDEFFPDDSYKSFDNFFATEEEMVANIVPTIRRLESDRQSYIELNRALRAKWDELYDIADYHARIDRLIAREYEIQPKTRV